MRKEQALHKFWTSFGVPAYDANTVPDDAPFPRITYEVATDSYDTVVSLTASIWSRSKAWTEATTLKDAVEDAVVNQTAIIDNVLYLRKREPFAQRMSDPDDSIRRIVLNLNAEYK